MIARRQLTLSNQLSNLIDNLNVDRLLRRRAFEAIAHWCPFQIHYRCPPLLIDAWYVSGITKILPLLYQEARGFVKRLLKVKASLI